MNLRRFARYGVVGLANTGVHWLVFFVLHLVLGRSQALSNVLAFAGAASLSYQLNARYTFFARPGGKRYLLFLAGMGGLSLAMGAVSDWARLSPWLTLVAFSTVSLVVGYSYSRTVVFRRRAP
ncbi:GtrA family protein [Pseudomonas guariconensis]|uniref:GtrA family protein n=1 Tax=Pseudomonas guariconensis TaxID=1288410 RepID=UPI0026D2A9FD